MKRSFKKVREKDIPTFEKEWKHFIKMCPPYLDGISAKKHKSIAFYFWMEGIKQGENK